MALGMSPRGVGGITLWHRDWGLGAAVHPGLATFRAFVCAACPPTCLALVSQVAVLRPEPLAGEGSGVARAPPLLCHVHQGPRERGSSGEDVPRVPRLPDADLASSPPQTQVRHFVLRSLGTNPLSPEPGPFLVSSEALVWGRGRCQTGVLGRVSHQGTSVGGQ